MYIFCDEKYTKYTKQKLSTPTKILETPNRHQVRKTKHQVRKTKHQIRQTKYQLRQTKHKVPQTKHKVRQPKYQVRQTKHQVHQVCNLIKKQMLICIPKYWFSLFCRKNFFRKFTHFLAYLLHYRPKKYGGVPKKTIIRYDGNVFFSRRHCHRWFFNGFTIPGPSPLNVFFKINHWNRWFFNGFSQIQVRWSAMVLTSKKTNKFA